MEIFPLELQILLQFRNPLHSLLLLKPWKTHQRSQAEWMIPAVWWFMHRRGLLLHVMMHNMDNSILQFIYMLLFFFFFSHESAPHRKWNVHILTNCWLPSINHRLDSDFLLLCCCVSCGGAICMISLFVQLIKTSGETWRHSSSFQEEMMGRSLLLPLIFFSLCLCEFAPSNWQLACVKGEKENKHAEKSNPRLCMAGPPAVVCGDYLYYLFFSLFFFFERNVSLLLTWILLLSGSFSAFVFDG